MAFERLSILEVASLLGFRGLLRGRIGEEKPDVVVVVFAFLLRALGHSKGRKLNGRESPIQPLGIDAQLLDSALLSDFDDLQPSEHESWFAHPSRQFLPS
jgi:hypothetical protein